MALRVGERRFVGFCPSSHRDNEVRASGGQQPPSTDASYHMRGRCDVAGDASLCSGIYCLHCGRLPLLNMPRGRLKEAAAIAATHPAGSLVKPEACWDALVLQRRNQQQQQQQHTAGEVSWRGHLIKRDLLIKHRLHVARWA